MNPQTAQLIILARGLMGTLVTITKDGAEPVPLENGHDALHNLLPGDRITIEIASDERWLEAQTEAKRLTDLDAQAAADIEANPQAGPNLTGEPGMTLDEGLRRADVDDPGESAAEASAAGAVVEDTGATRTRSTRAR